MSNYMQQLKEAVQAIGIHSPTTYSWFGKPSTQLSLRVRHALSPRDARNYLLYDLTFRLYRDFYCSGIATSGKREPDQGSQTGFTPFVAELSAANTGQGPWEEGWQICTITGETLEVFRGDLHIWTHLDDCMLFTPEVSIAPGTPLRLHFPKELLSISPGFYMVLSNKPLRPTDDQMLTRIYWNLAAEGAVPFVKAATSQLNQANLPFKLKVLRDPTQFTRCDASVIYVQKSDYTAVSDVLKKVYSEVSMHLKAGTPVFTKTLARGVGVADDPGPGESFGQSRCRLVADAIISAHEQGRKSLDARLHMVADRFATDGISLLEPFLNAGSRDDYALFTPSTTHVVFAQTAQQQAPSDNTMFLKTADELGRRLAREAVWHDSRCNWLGAEALLDGRRKEGIGLAYKTLGPALYSGTSGVALFLAELYAASGTDTARKTALGAIQQALCSVDTLPSEQRFALYTGTLGIVFAAARIGTLLHEAALQDRARQLLHQCIDEQQQAHASDLLSGDAGAIIACLVLRELLDDPALIDLAASLGKRLQQSADDTEAGCSWRSPGIHNRHNLTGFSHGTAGIGYALLELFRATRDTGFRTTAERAFTYERTWFNAEKGNWPDFRGVVLPSKQQTRALDFSGYWCHGAPGIALARLRAYEMLNDTSCKNEARIALHTTRKLIEETLQAGNGNFSLCHGLTGNAEVLLYGNQVLGHEWADASKVAQAVAHTGIESARKRGGAWRCGITSGETPGLLLGLAGIGSFYLRLYNPAIPSILLLRREDFSPQSSPA